mmetsp:Transcript_14181/g.30690  ORF Transcript_14181/g.30690 Transcript_14181/m.30690 type:complete len:1885 (-) Transcript_14181:36-5690(-)
MIDFGRRADAKSRCLGAVKARKKSLACYFCVVIVGVVLVPWLVKLYTEYTTFICPVGHWCFRDLFTYKCPAGRFGNTTNIFSENCTGVCFDGFFCPEGSTSPTQEDCPVGFYCPAGCQDPIPCPAGRYGSSSRAVSSVCDGLCEKGYYCETGSTSSRAKICPKGSYCPEGTTYATEYLCPQGTFGDVEGLSDPSCSGFCGGRAGYFCAEGTAVNGLEANDLAMKPCPLGSFCDGSTGDTSRQLCAPGLFSNELGVSTSSCSGECQEGYFCPAGSTSATQKICPKGYYCPAQSGEPQPCAAGSYGMSEGSVAPECDGPCPGGSWCPPGSWNPTGLPCPAGYYCTLGTTNYTEKPCFPGFACIAGTPFPSVPCSPGYYCPEATAFTTQYPCPAGTYGDTESLNNSKCTGICPAGQFCSLGTSNPKLNICPPGSYCPEGTTAHDENLCPGAGFSKRWGLKNVDGCFCQLELDSTCSLNGKCTAGYYCPPGSSEAKQYQCPTNYYCPTGVSSPILCTLPGYYCTVRAKTPKSRLNVASVFLLNNIQEKADLWALDNPAKAERMIAGGAMTLVEAFIEDSSRRTYTGSLYTHVYHEAGRGLDTLEVNITVKGFFNATVNVCDEFKNVLKTLGYIERSAPNSSLDPQSDTTTFTWDIPRDAKVGDATICIEMPLGDVPNAMVESSVFGVVRTAFVEPQRMVVVTLQLSCFGIIFIVFTPCFFLRASKARNGDVEALIKNKEKRIVQLVFSLTMIVELPQYLALTCFSPVFQYPSSIADPVRIGTYMAALHILPLVGYIPAGLFFGGFAIFLYMTQHCGKATFSFLYKLVSKWNKRRGRHTTNADQARAAFDTFIVCLKYLLFETLYIPIMMTALAPFDCVYNNEQDLNYYYEFEDQVFMRSMHVQCWHDGKHATLAFFGMGLVILYYPLALKFAFEEKKNYCVNYVQFYRVWFVVLKTLLCFLSSVQVPGRKLFEPVVFVSVYFALFLVSMIKQFRANPALGRNNRTNDLKFTYYLVAAYSAPWAIISTILNINIQDGLLEVSRVQWPLVHFFWSAPIVFLLGRKLSNRRSIDQIRKLDYIQISACKSSDPRHPAVDSTLDFLYNMYHLEKHDRENLTRRMEAFLAHLGELTQSDEDNVARPAMEAVLCLLRSNFVTSKHPKRLAIAKSSLKQQTTEVQNASPRISPLGEDDLEDTDPKLKLLFGEPEVMIQHCLHSMIYIELPQVNLSQEMFHLLARSIPGLHSLRLLDVSNNGNMDEPSLQEILRALGKSPSVMHFKFSQENLSNPLPVAGFGRQISQLFAERSELHRKDPHVPPMTRIDFGDQLIVKAAFRDTIESGHVRGRRKHELLYTGIRALSTTGHRAEVERELDLIASGKGIERIQVSVQVESPDIPENEFCRMLLELAHKAECFNLNTRIDLFFTNCARLKCELANVFYQSRAAFMLGTLHMEPFYLDENMSELNLENCKTFISDKDSRLLGGIFHTCSLEFVNLRGIYIHPSNLGTLGKAALESSQPARLLLNHVTLHTEQLKTSKQLLFTEQKSLLDGDIYFAAPFLKQNKNLERIHIYSTLHSVSTDISLSDGGVSCLAKSIRDLPSLEKVCLGNWVGGNVLTSNGIDSLARNLMSNHAASKSIVSLDLQNNGIDANACAALVEHLKSNTTLQSLKLSHNNLGDHGASSLGELFAENRSISKLYIAHNNIAADGITNLAKGLEINSTLKSIVLDSNDISCENAQSALYASLSGVTSLGMVNCGLKQLQTLSRFLQDPELCSHLTTLNLSGNERIGASDLCEALFINSTLESLNLHNCGLFDDHISLIITATASSTSKLQVLDVSSNLFTDQACEELVKILSENQTSLRCISLQMNPQISVDGIEYLKEKMPKRLIMEI